MGVRLTVETARSLADFLSGLEDLTKATGWRLATYAPDQIEHEDGGVLDLVRYGPPGGTVVFYRAEETAQ